MAEINIKVTASVQDFSQFADELGYLTEIVSGEEVIPNPENKQKFLESYFKRVVLTELLRRKEQVINNQINEAKEQEKQSLRAAVNSAITVTSQV